MIVELCREAVRPGALPQALERLAAFCAWRARFATLGGAWVTEIGPLNGLVHLWRFPDAAAQARAARAQAADAEARAGLDDLVERACAELLTPLPGGAPRPPGRMGPIYELRRYRTLPDGGLQRYIAGWEAHLERRLALSAPAFAGFVEVGAVGTLVQLWPYESLTHRAEVRRTAVETGVLPPPGAMGALAAMENSILLPAPFSPLQ